MTPTPSATIAALSKLPYARCAVFSAAIPNKHTVVTHWHRRGPSGPSLGREPLEGEGEGEGEGGEARLHLGLRFALRLGLVFENPTLNNPGSTQHIVVCLPQPHLYAAPPLLHLMCEIETRVCEQSEVV